MTVFKPGLRVSPWTTLRTAYIPGLGVYGILGDVLRTSYIYVYGVYIRIWCIRINTYTAKYIRRIYAVYVYSHVYLLICEILRNIAKYLEIFRNTHEILLIREIYVKYTAYKYVYGVYFDIRTSYTYKYASCIYTYTTYVYQNIRRT
jgi:hypothetical protein